MAFQTAEKNARVASKCNSKERGTREVKSGIELKSVLCSKMVQKTSYFRLEYLTKQQMEIDNILIYYYYFYLLTYLLLLLLFIDLLITFWDNLQNILCLIWD